MGSLLTADELAKRLKVRPSTVRRWSQDGLIPCIRVTGKVVRFDEVDVERALRQRAIEADGVRR